MGQLHHTKRNQGVDSIARVIHQVLKQEFSGAVSRALGTGVHSLSLAAVAESDLEFLIVNRTLDSYDRVNSL